MEMVEPETTIQVAIAPASRKASGLDFDNLFEFLAEKTSFSFNIQRCESYEEALSKLTNGEAQMGWLGPYAYLEANEKGIIQPFAVGLLKGQSTPTYNSLFISLKESNVEGLKNIKGTRIVIGNPQSTSGYLVPKRELKDVGVNLDNRLHFSEIIEANNHDEAIRILLEGRADVAAVSSVNLQENIVRNPEYAQRIRILHESKPIPGAPLVFSSVLPEKTKNTIKELVLVAHESVEISGYGGKLDKYIDIEEGKRKLLESYILPQWNWPTYLSISGLILFTILAIIDLEIDPLELFHNTFTYFSDVIQRMMPPDFSNMNQLLGLMLETVEMAFLGTLMAITLSIPLGFLSASNISPNYSIYVICRVITVFFRAVPEFVMAMILVIAVGFGAIPGVLALGLHTMGFLAKFYAEAIEHIDPGPSEALTSMNASRLQVLAFSIIPQVLPSFVGNNLYILDRNVRMATMLGIVGAGGIGYELQSSFRMFNYPRVSAIIIMIFVTIFIIDMVSSQIRRRVL